MQKGNSKFSHAATQRVHSCGTFQKVSYFQWSQTEIIENRSLFLTVTTISLNDEKITLWSCKFEDTIFWSEKVIHVENFLRINDHCIDVNKLVMLGNHKIVNP